jgi:type II secretory pathway component PulM
VKTGRIAAWFQGLSDRERKLVLGGGALLLVFVLGVGGLMVSRQVSALEEEVADNEGAQREAETLAPKYLKVRAEEKALTEQLERASKESLQATVLAIAKTVEYDKPDAEGNPQKVKLSDAVKFQNASEVLAELTQKRKGASSKKKHKKGQKEVFLATIECVFTGVPDTAIDRFMARVESHPDSLFGIAVDISRNNPSRDAFAATLKIGQFRFGTLEE